MRKGFTLIEILIVVGVMAILAAIVIIAINPARQFAQARNTQRRSDVVAILDAVHQRMVDNSGSFAEGTTCDALPSSASIVSSTVDPANVDLCDCLVFLHTNRLFCSSGKRFNCQSSCSRKKVENSSSFQIRGDHGKKSFAHTIGSRASLTSLRSSQFSTPRSASNNSHKMTLC